MCLPWWLQEPCKTCCVDVTLRLDCRPEEYPSSLEGLYHSSPDEALPQFYTDPAAFSSTHHNMRDLAVPEWAQDAVEFVSLHRYVCMYDLTSDCVGPCNRLVCYVVTSNLQSPQR
jgi:hypothetical protein